MNSFKQTSEAFQRSKQTRIRITTFFYPIQSYQLSPCINLEVICLTFQPIPLLTQETQDTTMLDDYLTSTKPVAPPPNRRGLVRSLSDSQSISLASKRSGLDSFFFHQSNATGFDDNDNRTFQSRFSDYQFSEASTRCSVALAGLNIIASQIDDNLSLYTSNTGPILDNDDIDALERAIMEGQKRASLEDQDEVMGLEEHQAYRASLQHTIREQNKRLFSSEGNTAQGVVLERSSSHDEYNGNDTCNTLKQMASQELLDRKEHRKNTRQGALAKKSAGRPNTPNTMDESSSNGTPETHGLDFSGNTNQSPPKARRGSMNNSKRNLMQRVSSQPMLLNRNQRGGENCSNQNLYCQDVQRIPPKGKSRPPQTKKTRAIVVSQDEVDDGRSRSLTRAMGNVVRRSLSRTKRFMRGDKLPPAEDAKAKDAKKLKCTCPAEDVMLRSCPRHGEKAKQILKKKAKSDEQKVVKKSSRRESKRDSSPTNRSGRRTGEKENRRSSTSSRKAEASKPSSSKRRERGRTKLASSQHTEVTQPISQNSFSINSENDGFSI